MPKFCLNVFTNCADPERHEEFNAWYSLIHLPDLSKAEGFVTARRFINSNAGPDSARYYAQYEFEHSEPGKAVLSFLEAALDAYKAGRHIDCISESQAGPGALWEEVNAANLINIDVKNLNYPRKPTDSILSAINAMKEKYN